jgi:hypothetical protein
MAGRDRPAVLAGGSGTTREFGAASGGSCGSDARPSRTRFLNAAGGVDSPAVRANCSITSVSSRRSAEQISHSRTCASTS